MSTVGRVEAALEPSLCVRDNLSLDLVVTWTLLFLSSLTPP